LESTKYYSPLFQNAEEIKIYLNENKEELFEIIQGKMV
jgi:hypothetical protein